MRIGHNPLKDKLNSKSEYLHQVIIPVYIPNFEGYFKDAFKIFDLCLQSLFKTIHNKTFITIVNNGSCEEIKDYLEDLYLKNKIHELINTQNIGKLNSILKGLAGNNIELVTISDADVLFLNNWQQETISIFNEIPKAGVVGIVPQFNLHKINSFNLIFENLFSNKLQFINVKNSEGLQKFYESIGWDKNYNHDYLKFALGLKWNPKTTVFVGSGHFVATYKKDIFNDIVSNISYKMGGNSESYLDEKPLSKDYWRVTTYDNFAFHLGNSLEDWMNQVKIEQEEFSNVNLNYNFKKLNTISKPKYIFKNKVLQKLFKIKFFYQLFLKFKKLPSEMIKTY